jgi:ATP-dependent helicase HrpA
VLATNVAETSLTVPGIRYVIDPGTARISRYSHRTKVQRLPIEAISRASADQRKGRCGRLADGVCIRLYTEADYAARPEFTDPEILRTNLASVILQMAALDLGEMADFPFVDPPDSRSVADGVRLLEELGAILAADGRPKLTEVGRKLARLPVDPRLGRMILEAGRNGCAGEVLIITAALSINDPRERPAESREAADSMHARFAEPGSDFLAYLKLWDYLRERQRALSGSAFRRMCRREYLHYLRVREWQDVHSQLRQAAAELGISVGREHPRASAGRQLVAGGSADRELVSGGPARRELVGGGSADRDAVGQGGSGQGSDGQDSAGLGSAGLGSAGLGSDGQGSAGQDSAGQGSAGLGAIGPGDIGKELADRVHISLLSGLLSQIGMRDTDSKAHGGRRPVTEFAGARGARFAISPGSALARRPPHWVVAAELVETSRLWARTVARIEPEWAEPLAPHLLRYSYSEPRWDARRGAAMATEKVTLYGLPVVAARQVGYGRIDPVAARQIFIRCALVEGDWQTHHRFFARNQRLLHDALDLERRARRPGLVAGDEARYHFYDRRIPAEVTSARHFDTWWKRARGGDPDLLTMTAADLAGPAAGQIEPDDYPASWGDLALSYEFAPGQPDDGVTVDVPLATLGQVSAEEFGWQVPGLREELVTELIRSLPKQLRRMFVPAPETARAVLARLGEPHGDLLTVLAAELGRLAGTPIPRDAWDLSRLPAHLRVTFRVLDADRPSDGHGCVGDDSDSHGRDGDGRASDGRASDGGAGPAASVLATGKDLAELQRELLPRLQSKLADAAADLIRSGLRTWADVGTLPAVFSQGEARAYPALDDAGDAAEIALFPTQALAAEALVRGNRRLLLIAVPSGARAVASRLPTAAKLAMSAGPYPGALALLDDCAACAADQLIVEAGGPAWDAARFDELLQAARAGLAVATVGVVNIVARVLTQAQQVQVALGNLTSPVLAPALADVREQFSGLIYPGFVAKTGTGRLPDLIRYLRAIGKRLEKMPDDPGRDADRMAIVHQVTADYRQTLASLPAGARDGADARILRWMIEELRVSLFAQTVGTPVPVSEQRIGRQLDRLIASS